MEDKFVVKDAKEESHFLAGDLCSLAEILHPKKKTSPSQVFHCPMRKCFQTDELFRID